ncbi:MAG: biopolymer transporter ExbD [Bacteroidota bacterium]
MALDFSSAKKPLSTFSLAGLTDIVLLLLIFFLLTSNFIPQFGIQVNLPQADAAARTEASYVSVAITDDGRYYVNQELTAPEALLEALRGVQGEQAAVLLRADKDATIEQFATVANIAKALDMRVLMATDQRRLTP